MNAALLDGRVDFESFDEGDRSRLAEASRATSLAVAPEFEDGYPGRWGAAVSGHRSMRRLASADGQHHAIPEELVRGAEKYLRVPSKVSYILLVLFFVVLNVMSIFSIYNFYYT